MPIYEYVCTACGHPVEVMHSFTAPGPERCERCGAPMRKALSTPAIVFKGSGWAKKDHRDKVHAASKTASAPDAATPGAPSGGGAGEGKEAATPAAQSPAAPSTAAPAASAAPAATTAPAPAKADPSGTV